MSNFWSLVYYEHKKVLTFRFLVLFLVLLVFISFSSVGILIGNVYIDDEISGSKYEAYLIDKNHALVLSGEEIDIDLLKRARDAYALYPEFGTLSEQREIATQYIEPYEEIGRFLTTYYGTNDWVEIGALTDEELATFDAMMIGAINKNIDSAFINENSKSILYSMSQDISTPLVYQFGDGFNLNITMLASNGLIFAFFIIILLSGIFSGDYRTNVFSLQRTSKKGKGLLFKAKIFTVFSITFMIMLAVTITTTIICLSVYGSEGITSAYQNFNRLSPYPFSIFEVMLIYFVVVFMASVTIAFIVCFLSGLTKSSVTVLGIGTLMLIVPQFINISPTYPILYRFLALYPTSAYVDYMMFSTELYEFGNISIMPFVFIPMVHLLTVITLIFLSYRVYIRRQV